jgi:hypothetical protein
LTHSTPSQRAARATARSSRSAASPVAHGFALLAEVLLIGAMTAFAAVGVVTAFGAIAAGCASLRDFLDHGIAPGPRRYLSLLRVASRGAVSLLALPVLLVLVAADLLAWRAGMPGGRVLGPAALVIGLAAAVVGLRAAASWRPEPEHEPDGVRRPAPWTALLPEAAAETVADWRGSLLIACALAACAALALEIPMLTPVLPGLLTLSSVAVHGRAR